MQDREQQSVAGWKPAASASYWINRASRVLIRMQDARLKAYGFGMGQMPVLHALAGGDSLSQKDLAAFARVEQPTMAEMLSRMERDGVVERSPNPQDGRGSLTSLTRRARDRFPKAQAELVEAEKQATAGLSKAEKEQLVALLQRVAENLEAAQAKVLKPR